MPPPFGETLRKLDWRRYVIYIGFVVVFAFFAILLRDQ
ncbi:ABC transporter permease, partial [Methylobacterium radiotolerans]